jgi:methionyl-tRNA formyltransferase
VPSLGALALLAQEGAIDIAAVVTQPDRAGDRGRVEPSAVKRRALELGLPVRQPVLFDADAAAELTALRPDALVWAAYGNLIPRRLIDAANGRALNVHASLLPRWRGASPVAHAILAGDTETGVTLMEGTASLDRGPMVSQGRIAIGPDDTAATLTAQLGEVGGALLRRDLPGYLTGDLRRELQDERRATWAPKLTTKDGELHFAEPAEALERRVRAMDLEPGAWTSFRGQRLGVLRAAVTGGRGVQHGTLELRDGVPHVAGGAGWLRLDEVKPAGKRAMSGAEWARGLRLTGSERLGSA